MVLGRSQAVSRRGFDVDCEFARELVGAVDGLLGEVLDGVAPLGGGSVLFALVVDDGCGEGAGDGPEDEPVARGELAR